MALVDSRGFQLVPDVSNLTNQLNAALGQRREQQRQDELLKQKADAAKLQKDFKTTGAQMLGVRDITDFTTQRDRKSTRLNSSHQIISYAVFCLKKKKKNKKHK